MPTTKGKIYYGSTILSRGTIAPDAPSVTDILTYNNTTDKWDLVMNYSWTENGATVMGAEYTVDGGETWVTAPSPGSYVGSASYSYSGPNSKSYGIRLIGSVANGVETLIPGGVPALPYPATPIITNTDITNTTLTIYYSWTPSLALTTDVEYRLNGGSWISVDQYANNTTSGSALVTGLADGVSYDVEIRFAGAHRAGSASQISHIQTVPYPAGSMIEFTSSTTWTVPADLYDVTIFMQGGGGGGGRGGNANTGPSNESGAGGGGGAGFTRTETLTLTPGNQYSIIVGAGGAGGSAAGGPGGSSSFGNLTPADGGGGGGRGTDCNSVNDQGNHPGGAGGAGSPSGSPGQIGDHSGTSQGGAGGVNNTNLAGAGGAGGRGTSSGSGQPQTGLNGSGGSPGVVRITW